MQWLFDIVVDMVRLAGCYVNRGDNTPNDFTTVDFTLDGAWHALDLSAIVPENAHAINLKVNVRNNAISQRFDVRVAGQVNTVNLLSLWTQVGGVRLGGVYPVNVGSSRIIEYRSSVAGWTLVFMNVNGWWF